MRSAKIEGFENYTIYENGDVWRDDKKHFMTPSLNGSGYYKVHLCKYGKDDNKLVHRLLGLAFIPNPENKPFIDHIDRNRTNNNLNNLRWATMKENNNNKNIGKGCINIKEKKYIRFCWSINGKTKSKSFKTIEEAKRFQLLSFCFHIWKIQ